MGEERRTYPTEPVIGVGAVVWRGDKVLLVRRGREPDRGKWAYPGGRLSLGETVAEAALRELREETGVTAEPGPVIATHDLITRDGAGEIRFHYLLVFVSALWRAGEAIAGDDALAVAWAGRGEIAGLDCCAGVDRVYAHGLRVRDGTAGGIAVL